MPIAELRFTEGKAEHNACVPRDRSVFADTGGSRGRLGAGVSSQGLGTEQGPRRADTEGETSLSSLKKYLYGYLFWRE